MRQPDPGNRRARQCGAVWVWLLRPENSRGNKEIIISRAGQLVGCRGRSMSTTPRAGCSPCRTAWDCWRRMFTTVSAEAPRTRTETELSQNTCTMPSASRRERCSRATKPYRSWFPWHSTTAPEISCWPGIPRAAVWNTLMIPAEICCGKRRWIVKPASGSPRHTAMTWQETGQRRRTLQETGRFMSMTRSAGWWKRRFMPPVPTMCRKPSPIPMTLPGTVPPQRISSAIPPSPYTTAAGGWRSSTTRLEIWFCAAHTMRTDGKSARRMRSETALSMHTMRTATWFRPPIRSEMQQQIPGMPAAAWLPLPTRSAIPPPTPTTHAAGWLRQPPRPAAWAPTPTTVRATGFCRRTAQETASGLPTMRAAWWFPGRIPESAARRIGRRRGKPACIRRTGTLPSGQTGTAQKPFISMTAWGGWNPSRQETTGSGIHIMFWGNCLRRKAGEQAAHYLLYSVY